MGVVSRRWMLVESMGVVVRRYIDYLILLIPTPLVSVLFCSSIPTFCSLYIIEQAEATQPLGSFSWNLLVIIFPYKYCWYHHLLSLSCLPSLSCLTPELANVSCKIGYLYLKSTFSYR